MTGSIPPAPEEGEASTSDGSRAHVWIKLGGLLPLVLGGAVYLLSADFRASMHEGVGLLVSADIEGLEAWAEEFGWWAPVATGILMVVQAIAAPIPAVFITWANSLLFGPFLGGLWSIFSATLAASLCFALARVFGTPLIGKLVPASTLARTDELVERHGATAVLVARLVPIVPFDPISYVAGLSKMRFSVFFWATLFGQIPAGMTYSYLGQEIGEPAKLALLGGGAFLGLLLIGLGFRRALLRRS